MGLFFLFGSAFLLIHQAGLVGSLPMHHKRALISVSDKNGVADFARSLSELGFESYFKHKRNLSEYTR